MKNANKALVSVIVPVFNAEKYIKRTVESVKAQTYDNWELILVNDCSSDNSLKIILDLADKDKRIKVISLDKNSGAAVARNMGIEKSKGGFICFIDSDDLWKTDKLEKQLEFIEKTGCEFCYTSYIFANEDGNENGKTVHVPEKISYKQALKNTTIFTSTVMFNMAKLSKNDIYMPEVRRGQDTATWWKVLKKIDCAYGLDEILSVYCRPVKSLSSNKIKALQRTWNLYRNVEQFSIVKSFYYFSFYVFNGLKRRGIK